MRTLFRLDVKNNWIVKGRQFEGVRKVAPLDDRFTLPSPDIIEELVILDLTRSVFSLPPNYAALEFIAARCHLPITFGGGIQTIEHAMEAFARGASRVYLNSAIHRQPNLIPELVAKVGAQAIVAGCEYRPTATGHRQCYADAGREPLHGDIAERAYWLESLGVGEIMAMAIDRDGLQNGLDLEVAVSLKDLRIPLIIAGGGQRENFEQRFTGNQAMEGQCYSSLLLTWYE